jgi:outer membrane protein assembly factor BamA
VKKVPDTKHLLTKNTIVLNGKVTKKGEVAEQIYQTPNTKLLGMPIYLTLYNLAKENPDSLYNAWLYRKPNRYSNLSAVLSEKQVERLGQSFIVSGYSKFLENIGEPPTIIDLDKSRRSTERLKNYFFNQGYFNTKTSYKVDTLENKRAQITYLVETEEAYIIDSLKVNIFTKALDSLYNLTKNQSLIKTNQQYNVADLNAERNRLTTYFRNRGAYHFQQSYINFEVDTVNTKHKANIRLIISEQNVRKGDSLYTKPFNIYTISEVNIFTDNPYDKDSSQTIDSVRYNGINIYSSGNLRFRPKAITDPIFLSIGRPYSDFRDQLTRRYLNNLEIFNYPTIHYVEDESDPSGNSLIANIQLSSKKKFNLNPSLDFTHSNIQVFGIEGNTAFSVRNVFKGAEVLQLGFRSNFGSSQDLANPNNTFFNIIEYGTDIKLSVPRILFPVKTEKIISRQMIPSTMASFGFFKQQNIGLDKENFTGVVSYSWTPSFGGRANFSRTNMKFDLLNVQYIRNINASNYFNVYSSSYNRLNNLAQEYGANPTYLDENGNLLRPEGTTGFINDVFQGQSPITIDSEDYRIVRSIEERRKRLTENNLVLASNLTYQESTQTNLYDNSFYAFKVKVESAGAFLSLLSNVAGREKNERDRYDILKIDYSQYAKVEGEFVKHFDLGGYQVLASRIFGGIAIPYENSSNIPFSRSYFAGGSNDNRGWQSYSLGPGSSGGLNDYNEANMKLAASVEYRFKLLGKLNSAFFVDAGNIWNVFDDVTDEGSVFEGFRSLKDIAVGSGIGFRYDLGFVIFRLDLGFKTYNPSNNQDNRWFRNYRFSESVLNIGINYPF